jgi:uncharacterized protein YkwD
MRRRDDQPSKERGGLKARAGGRAAVAAAVAAAAVVTGVLLWSSPRDGTPRPAAPSQHVLASGAPDAPKSTGPAPGTPTPGPRLRAGGVMTATPSEPADEVVALVNARRAEAGCPPVRRNDRLQQSARAHAADMAARDYYRHRSPEGRDGGDRISATGYSWRKWGENIYRGPQSPAEAVDGWMRSASHRKNILDCSFKEIGVGVSVGGHGPSWVQNFGSRS